MKVTRNGNVISVFFDVSADWTQWLMLRSDAHHDSPHCNHALELAQLHKAVARDALILDGGDLADAMQGRFDPRRSYADLRPEYLKPKNGVVPYYDNIVDELYAFYKPFVSHWLMFARGNHESSVVKNAQTDITGNLVHRLNAESFPGEAGGNIQVGNYGGYVRFMFHAGGVPQGRLVLRYFHGAGGEAPVTRGTIQTNRQAVYLSSADLCWNGHSHNDYVLDIEQERLSNKGNIYFSNCTYIRTPGYADMYGDGSCGWEVERGGVPKPMDRAWVKLGWDATKKRPYREVYLDVE